MRQREIDSFFHPLYHTSIFRGGEDIMGKSFFVIDGSSYIFRAFYAIRELSNTAGLPTNAVYGFTRMLQKMIKEKSPDYLAIAFDAKGPTFRHERYEQYKAQRPPMPDPLARQIPYIHQMVAAFRIPILQEQGLEADDLIGTLAQKGAAAGLEVVIVSGDKDMYQLITPKITLYDSMKDRLHTEASIQEKFGIAPNQIVDMMGLMGDAVDNIPGVAGVGQKTAVQLIQTFGSIENLFSRLDEVKKPKLREKLEAGAETARLSRELATIKTDCALDFDLKTFEARPPDEARLLALCQELEFYNLFKELAPAPKTPAFSYEMIDATELSSLISEIKKEGAVALRLLSSDANVMDA
ncbi:MAG: 5'-3' exonuclease H3TH domain-containing protein, partial [Nitrospiria bacterium]